jgi:hypothetical protein
MCCLFLSHSIPFLQKAFPLLNFRAAILLKNSRENEILFMTKCHQVVSNFFGSLSSKHFDLEDKMDNNFKFEILTLCYSLNFSVALNRKHLLESYSCQNQNKKVLGQELENK